MSFSSRPSLERPGRIGLLVPRLATSCSSIELWPLKLVEPVGIEPTTACLQNRSSPTELRPHLKLKNEFAAGIPTSKYAGRQVRDPLPLGLRFHLVLSWSVIHHSQTKTP